MRNEDEAPITIAEPYALNRMTKHRENTYRNQENLVRKRIKFEEKLKHV